MKHLQFFLLFLIGVISDLSLLNAQNLIDDAQNIYIDSIVLDGASFDTPYNKMQRWYFVTAESNASSVKLRVATNPKYAISLNDTLISDNKYSNPISLAVGYTAVKITIQHVTEKKDYYLTIYKKFNSRTQYSDSYRPTYHFTPFKYQMNDPNGLVYNEETKDYHLFFQTNRPINYDKSLLSSTATTSWGHAISKDLISWEELPLAITPDELGVIYSGSGVIDKHNTSGLFDERTLPGSRMVLFYTSIFGINANHGVAKQSLAYSTDNGHTFIKYAGNPIIANKNNEYGKQMRDPKVIWLEDASYPKGGVWLMVTADSLACLFTSENLIDWKHNSTMKFNNIVECPDLYPIAVDGNSRKKKWIFSAGGTFYLIGDLVKDKGLFKFVPESGEVVPLEGFVDQFPKHPVPETYAAQSYYNDPKGRRITVSWIRDPFHKQWDKEWNSAQTIPLETSLKTLNGALKLVKYPSEEVNAYRGNKIINLKDAIVDPTSANILKNIDGIAYDIEAVFDPYTAKEFGFKLYNGNDSQYVLVKYVVAENKLYVDKTNIGDGWKGVYSPSMTPLSDGTVKLRIMMDNAIFDVYGNGGEQAITGMAYPRKDTNTGKAVFYANGGKVKIKTMMVYTMNPMQRSLR